jgi:hypothetical protein
MLLKLGPPWTDEIGQTIEKGTIVKWHKREGEWVDYGDDLLDLKVQELGVPEMLSKVKARISELKRRPAAIARLATTPPAAGPSVSEELLADGAGPLERVPWVLHLRIAASDRGFVRRICVQEGEGWQAGDPLALVTTDAAEPIGGEERALPAASRFRLVPNALDAEPNLPPDLINRFAMRQKARAERKWTGDRFVILWSEPPEEKRIGIYALGGCDLPIIFACAPLIHPLLKGVCGITHHGHISQTHSNQLLQTLEPLPWEAVNTVTQKMRLDPECFRPHLFEKEFVVPGPEGPEAFPKTVMVLSIGPDVVRTLYRHRELGFLVDPGGGWLNHPLDDVLASVAEDTRWFRSHFESIGKLTLEEFTSNWTRMIELLKSTGHKHILVFNLLTVEPDSRTHNYQFLKNSEGIRRLEFSLALVELSRKLDVSIVDVDRILKRAGIQTQVDWGHSDPRVSLLVAQELVRIIQERGVL